MLASLAFRTLFAAPRAARSLPHARAVCAALARDIYRTAPPFTLHTGLHADLRFWRHLDSITGISAALRSHCAAILF